MIKKYLLLKIKDLVNKSISRPIVFIIDANRKCSKHNYETGYLSSSDVLKK
jgi:hypothetical protein